MKDVDVVFLTIMMGGIVFIGVLANFDGSSNNYDRICNDYAKDHNYHYNAYAILERNGTFVMRCFMYDIKNSHGVYMENPINFDENTTRVW